MKLSLRFPLWLSILGYILFFVMVVGFTVFLPWIVPVSLIVGAVVIGSLAWGIHRRKVNLLIAILMVALAFVFFLLAFRGFVVFVESTLEGKVFLVTGVTGMAIIFLGRERREIKEFERFIGFETPFRKLRKNSSYLAGSFFDFKRFWRRVYKPRPKSSLSSGKKRRLF